MKLRSLLIAVAMTGAAAGASAVTYTLDFSGSICGAAGNAACGDGSQIGQNYGDVTGVLDVSHRSLTQSTGLVFEPYLKHWLSNYSNLTSVAWGGAAQTNYISEMRFTPLGAGQIVTLNSFDFGDYLNRNFGSSAMIMDAGTSSVLWSSGSFDPGLTAINYAPNVSSAVGLVLRWGPDGYDVGIDNIAVSVSAVPEAESWALMAAGLALVGAAARRRAG